MIMRRFKKPLAWLASEIKTPPFSAKARLEAGVLLRRLQSGDKISMPHSRPMRAIGRRCHELRISDDGAAWRIIYRIDHDAILMVDLFEKKVSQTPKKIMDICKARIRAYDHAEK